jgi:hypothetical protein
MEPVPKANPVSLEQWPDGLLFRFSDGTFKLYPTFGGIILFSAEEVAKLRLTRINRDDA